MKINAKTLLKELIFVKNAIGKKSVNIMFGCFKFTVENDIVNIMATNMEVVCSSSCYLESPSNEFSFCVEAHFFTDIISKFDDIIDIDVVNSDAGNNIVITSDGSKYTIPTYDVIDFPSLVLDTTEHVFNMEYPILKQGINIAKNSVVVDPLRPSISGLLISAKNNTIIGINLSNMSLFECDIDGEEKIFIHKDNIGVLTSIDSNDTINVYSNDVYYKFEVGVREMYIQKMDNTYMNYERFFDNVPSKVCDVNRDELLQKLQRLMASNKEVIQELHMTMASDGLTLKTSSYSFGITGEEHIECVCNKEINVIFNIKLLINLLSSRNSIILHLHLNNEKSPMHILGDDNIKNLLMPLGK